MSYDRNTDRLWWIPIALIAGWFGLIIASATRFGVWGGVVAWLALPAGAGLTYAVVIVGDGLRRSRAIRRIAREAAMMRHPAGSAAGGDRG